MRIEKSVLVTISGFLLVGVSTTAFAGSYGTNCGGGVVCNSNINQRVMAYEGVRNTRCNQTHIAHRAPAPADCTASVVNHGGGADPLAPVNTYNSVPYDYLKTVEYKNTPNVNVMRVRARQDMAPLHAAPTSFPAGCATSAGNYCRTQAPVMHAPMPRPVMVAPPMMRAPVVQVRPQVRIASGYDASKFIPRQIGDNVLTPGVAHIPTSIVDRSPITHIGGVAQQRVSSVTTLRGANIAPQMRPSVPQGRVIGHVSGGSYTYQPQDTADYWEKTSGPTVVDGLPATQILCRRQGTRPAPVTVNVTRPVIGVPRPVPTPVAVPVRAAQTCAPAPLHAPMMRAPMMQPRAHMPQMPARPSSRWTY